VSSQVTRICIGSSGEEGIVEAPLNAPRELDYLSTAARDQVVRGDRLKVPWDVALLLLDRFESDEEDEDETLDRFLPAWLTQEDEDAEALLNLVLRTGLPKRTPYTIELQAKGRAGDSGYALPCRWRDEDGRRVRGDVEVEGGLVVADPPLRLSYGQFALLRELRALPPLGANRASDLLATDRVKTAVPPGDTGVRFDSFLQRERAVLVEKVRPRLERVPGGWQVRPSAEDVPDALLEKHYYKSKAADLGTGVLVARDADAARTRAVLDGDTRAGLQKCRELDVLTPQQTAQAMSRPEEVFGDALDLSMFSERVTGLGPPVRRAFPVLKEIPSLDWWDWDAVAELESVDGEDATGVGASTSLSLKDPEVRAQLRSAIKEADEKGDQYIPSPSGEEIIEVSRELRQALDNADKLAASADPSTGKLKKPPKEVLQIKENIEHVLFDRVAPPVAVERPQVGPPPEMRAGMALKPHQVEGYEWLVGLFGGEGASSWRGALLADDMGLGKTLQVLAFLSWAASRNRGGPHLIVAPVALLENWQREAREFFGHRFEPIFPVRGADLPSERPTAAARLSAQRLVLVSYETLRRRELIFGLVKWDVMILDEAQKAKDPATQIHRVVCAMDANARIAVTGTPVENSLKELWSMYHWAEPGRLGSLRAFADEFIKPLKRADEAQRSTLASRVHERIGPVFMRRMKREVLRDLPPINFTEERVGLSPQQEAAYTVAAGRAQSVGKNAIAHLHRLFAACSHPGLDANSGELAPRSEVTFPKVNRVFELLNDIANASEKVLVFANRKKLQWWLANEIEAEFGCSVDIINGDVANSTTRLKIIDKFSAARGFAALVLSPRAAGVGLNITAANHVIHYTREWNPAVENQATDRAYRIGQDKPVSVHYMIATSEHGTTVEEKLAGLLAEKRELMNDFVVPMGAFELKAADFERDMTMRPTMTTAPPREPREEVRPSTPQSSPRASPSSVPADTRPAATSRPPHELVRALATSSVFEAQCKKIAADRVERLMELCSSLLYTEGMLGEADFARAAGEPVFRVGGLVEQLQRLLNVDGAPVVEHDRMGKQIQLNVDLFTQLFER